MRLGSMLATVAIASSLGLAATPAHSGNDTLCPGTTKACIYINRSFQGLIARKTKGQPTTNTSAPEQMSSWENPTIQNGAWFDARDGRGDCYNMHQRTEVRYVGDPYNDDMISWRMNGGCS